MIIGFFIFVLGLILGSFANAVLYRQEKEISMKGRSFCPSCKHTLSWLDLVPVFSWLFLRGKCRYCKKPISIQYPLVELLMGFTFVAVGVKAGLIKGLNNLIFGNGSSHVSFLVAGQEPSPLTKWVPGLCPGMTGTIILVLLLLITFCLLLIAIYDLKTQYVLSRLVYLGIAAAITYSLLTRFDLAKGQSLQTHVSYILAAVIPAGIFWSISYFSKGKWMGDGDAEIALLIGFFLGWPLVLIAYYFAFIVGSIVGVIIVFTKKAKMNSAIPLGPFLVAGTFFSFFFGQQIIDFYVKIFL